MEIDDIKNKNLKELSDEFLIILDNKDLDVLEKLDTLIKYSAVINNKSVNLIKKGDDGFDELSALSFYLQNLGDSQYNSILKTKDKVALSRLISKYKQCIYYCTKFLESIEGKLNEYIQ